MPVLVDVLVQALVQPILRRIEDDRVVGVLVGDLEQVEKVLDVMDRADGHLRPRREYRA
jgi:hypothetical protein